MSDDLVRDGLAVYRIWRLWALDEITEPPRSAVNKWLFAHERNRVVYLLGCPWCLGAWLCIAAVIARRYMPRAWSVIAYTAATSAIVGLVAYAEDRLFPQ